MMVIGSGKSTVADNPPSKKPNSNGLPTKTFTFVYDKPSFPGTIVAGIFQEYKSDEAGMDLRVFFKPDHQKLAPEYTTTAVQEFTYFITLYGTPLSQRLNVVELPGDTVPYAWGPGNRRHCWTFDHGKKRITVCWRMLSPPMVGSVGESCHEG